MSHPFRFKQFTVDQTDCAMKINTDGVLLGAMAVADNPAAVLDVGTGTGVIALMLAQRFTAARIDAVEIDTDAAQTAKRNFEASPFADRLTLYAAGFENYFEQYPERKHDLIVSNPPFYIGSLKSPGAKKTLAKHTDTEFFERLTIAVANHLTANGCCWLIFPETLAEIIRGLAGTHSLFLQQMFNVQSYPQSQPHRVVMCLGFKETVPQRNTLVIYNAEKVYSEAYKVLLQPYFLAF